MTTEWAVITGASAGLGVAYAERLASDGHNLVLAARREELLNEQAHRLRETYGIEVRVRPVDLASEAGRRAFVEEVRQTPVHTLINNAGRASVGNFAQLGAERVAQEVSLNVGALTELSHAVAANMVDRGRGAIVNVASTAAFQPMPELAVYAATKGYVLQFTVALWEELRGTGVRALAICPGPTSTEFFDNAGNDGVLRSRRTPEQVIETTFRALAAHEPFVIDGTRSKVMALANRFAPRGLSAKVARYVLHNT